MRPDMSKVIVERPRPGSRSRTEGSFRQALKGAANDAILGKDLEGLNDLGRFLGMTRLHKDRRSFNEYLQPLRRYILAQIGRRWDDVYSEICEHLNRKSTVHDHIFTHLFSYVERNTYLGDDGLVYVNAEYGYRYRGDGGGPIPADDYYCDTYVHPISGIICKPNTKTYEQKRKAARAAKHLEDRRKKRVINERLMFMRDEDNPNWFRVELEPAKDAWEKLSTLQRETFRHLKYFATTCRDRYGCESWPTGQRKSASKKDIKDHGLNHP